MTMSKGQWPRLNYKTHDRARRCASDKRAPFEERSDFEIDRSRIVHSAAFRRLQGKTQVFTIGESDFFRTRLTHSLEVAQIGKGLAIRLGAHTDIVEAACLLHDIGHPPFGHAGEKELKTLMADYGGFEANAQNIRIITRLENKSHQYDGLNLTRAVIDAQLKYKNIFANVDGKYKDKFIYDNDLTIVKWASLEAQRTIEGAELTWKSFECEIMDLADDIAYAVHDLEDSIRANYINALTFFQDDGLIRSVIAKVSEEHKCTVSLVAEIYGQLVSDMQNVNPDLQRTNVSPSEKAKKINRKRLTSHLIGKYIKSSERTDRPDALDLTKTPRYLHKASIPVEHAIEISLIKQLVVEFVIDSP